MSDEPNSPKQDWRWIDIAVIIAIHDRQLAEHGGSEGIRDLGAVESALARAINTANYGQVDAAALAAAFAHGLAKNHGFVDGNKRTAWIAARLFLVDNGFRLSFDPLEAVRLMEGVASGAVSQTELAGWFRTKLI